MSQDNSNYKYISGHDESVLKSHAWRTAENSAAYLLPHLKPDMKLLDAGCGPGTITLDFAALLLQGSVVGIDPSPEVVEKATQTAKDRGITNVTFKVGDVMNLRGSDFQESSFDVIHAHQVLQHITDPVKSLQEMHHVLKPGGVVACREADFSAMAWWPQIPALDHWRNLWQKVARSSGCNPDIGRQLVSLALQAGFERDQITATTTTWTFSSAAEREWWGSMWEARMHKSDFPTQVKDREFGSDSDMQQMANGWSQWKDSEDGWFVLIHSEVLCRKA